MRVCIEKIVLNINRAKGEFIDVGGNSVFMSIFLILKIFCFCRAAFLVDGVIYYGRKQCL